MRFRSVHSILSPATEHSGMRVLAKNHVEDVRDVAREEGAKQSKSMQRVDGSVSVTFRGGRE